MSRAQIVMADAQFGTERILRPQANFENLLQGQPAALNPLYFYPRGIPLDPQAGQPGYASNLIRGLSVPAGARLIVKFPDLRYDDGAGAIRGYIWVFQWRTRNLFDFRTQRIPWHLPAGRGPDDTSVSPPEARVVIPGSYNSVIYNQPEPVSAGDPDGEPAVQKMRREDLRIAFDRFRLPLIATGVGGIVQQGIQDPGVVATAGFSAFINHEMQALEDELIVALTRDTGDATWDFTFPGGADAEIGAFLGTELGDIEPNNGVYVKAGTAP